MNVIFSFFTQRNDQLSRTWKAREWGKGKSRELGVRGQEKSKPKGYESMYSLSVFHVLLLSLFCLIKYSFSRAWFYFIFLL